VIISREKKKRANQGGKGYVSRKKFDGHISGEVKREKEGEAFRR